MRSATAGRALDALAARGEAGDQGVRQADGADVGDVVESGPAVDEDVVEVLDELVLESLQEPGGQRSVHEGLPVELRERREVALVLGAGRKVVELAALGETPVDLDQTAVEGNPVGRPVVEGGGRFGTQFGLVRLLQKVRALEHQLGRPADEFEHPRRAAQLALAQKRMQEAVQPRRVEVPVDHQHALARGSEDPGRVGERHRPSRTALVRVERDDPARARVIAGHGVPSGTSRRPVPLRDNCE